jgi:hypothetical protein
MCNVVGPISQGIVVGMLTAVRRRLLADLSSRDDGMTGKLGEPADGFRPQRRCVPRDGGFTRPFDARQPAIQSGDEFLELARERARAHRHGWIRLAPVSRREAFQISPQPPHRQYVLSSGFRAVVEIERD